MRFLKRALPFLLTLIVGVSLGGLLKHRPHHRHFREGVAYGGVYEGGKVRASSTPVSYSRTWLIVKSRPTLPRPFVSHGTSELQVVQLRAKFGADGKVSQVLPLSESLPVDLVTSATDAAWCIKFIPPTEDARPLAATVDLTYEGIAACACGNDLLDDGRCQGGHILLPIGLNVGIVSVEGARESEGWRVVYE
ncbi:MAG: hypothetical protein QOF61_10 [Acidobacteriota bacterium]|jgi:hypothetical protein|nr:hypothetical protein [Acidobacteriota bacterium]